MYRDLLKKYMAHVGEMEGVYFIEHPQGREFTTAEYLLLNKIMEEIQNES